MAHIPPWHARFAQRLLVRPVEGGGPEEILARSAEIAERLEKVIGLGREEPVEAQKWGKMRTFEVR